MQGNIWEIFILLHIEEVLTEELSESDILYPISHER